MLVRGACGARYVANRFANALARIDAGAVVQPGDRLAIREALEHQITRISFLQLDDWGWRIGEKAYPNWVGFGHVHKLLSHPRERIHVYDLTHQPNFENSRKSVQKAVGRALDELGKAQPEIGEHLKSQIKTGERCVYLGTWDWRVSHESTAGLSAMQG